MEREALYAAIGRDGRLYYLEASGIVATRDIDELARLGLDTSRVAKVTVEYVPLEDLRAQSKPAAVRERVEKAEASEAKKEARATWTHEKDLP